MEKFEQADLDAMPLHDRAKLLVANIKALQSAPDGDFVVRLAKMRKALDEAATLIERYADRSAFLDAFAEAKAKPESGLSASKEKEITQRVMDRFNKMVHEARLKAYGMALDAPAGDTVADANAIKKLGVSPTRLSMHKSFDDPLIKYVASFGKKGWSWSDASKDMAEKLNPDGQQRLEIAQQYAAPRDSNTFQSVDTGIDNGSHTALWFIGADGHLYMAGSKKP
jgi:hypothetical protein